VARGWSQIAADRAVTPSGMSGWASPSGVLVESIQAASCSGLGLSGDLAFAEWFDGVGGAAAAHVDGDGAGGDGGGHASGDTDQRGGGVDGEALHFHVFGVSDAACDGGRSFVWTVPDLVDTRL